MTKCELSSLVAPSHAQSFKEDFSTISYHYRRLFKMIGQDVRKGLKKPASGKRSIAPLSTHQAQYLKRK